MFLIYSNLINCNTLKIDFVINDVLQFTKIIMENNNERGYLVTTNYSKLQIGESIYARIPDIKYVATDSGEKSFPHFPVMYITKKKLFELKEIIYVINLNSMSVEEIINPKLDYKTFILIDGVLLDLNNYVESLIYYINNYSSIYDFYDDNGRHISLRRFRYVSTDKYISPETSGFSSSCIFGHDYMFGDIYFTEAKLSENSKNIFELGYSSEEFINKIKYEKMKLIVENIIMKY